VTKDNSRVLGTLTLNGYLKTHAMGKQWLVHRLAWYLATGELPILVDHINGIKTDNRLCNLRATDKRGNGQNLKGPRSSNKTGYLGVSFSKEKQKYVARLRVERKYLHLGYHSTPEAAYEAYLVAKRKYHECNTL
jgi:hypothetical protein